MSMRNYIQLVEGADTKEPLGYAIEYDDFKNLWAIMTALFGNGTPLTSDRRRDLANHMQVVLMRVEGNPIND